jgi:predicted dehydrogenase
MISLDKRIKYGIVGLGTAGRIHAEALKNVSGTELLAICDISDNKRELARRLYGARIYTDFATMALDRELDAVSICLPHHLHASASIAFLKREISVLCEKPLATTIADSHEMIEAAQANNALLSVVFQHRYEMINQLIMQEIQQGLLGKIISTSISIKWQKASGYYNGWQGKIAEAGGGVLINQAIHYVDLAQWFNGGCEVVYGMAVTARPNISVEDNAIALVVYKNGAFGSFDCSTCVNPMMGSGLDIVGSNYSIRTRDGEIVIWGRKTSAEINNLNEQIRQHGKFRPGKNYYGYGHKLQIQDFVQCIRESK